MTIYRFSTLAFLVLTACTVKDDNAGPPPSPSLSVQTGKETYTVSDLLRLQRENPNNFVVAFKDFKVRGEIASIPLFDVEAQSLGYPYEVPLKAGYITPDPQIEDDFRNLSTLELELKYGEDVAGRMNSARVREGLRDQDPSSPPMTELIPFEASMQMQNFDIQKAANLRVGQVVEIRCGNIGLSPIAISFFDCSME